MIPYLCPELPVKQKEALHLLVKTPLVRTRVALRNWRAFEKLQFHRVYAPGGYHTHFHRNPHVNIGVYRSAQSSRDPIAAHGTHALQTRPRSMIKIGRDVQSC